MSSERTMTNLPITLVEQMVSWRHQIHRYPETAYTEFKTAALVAKVLQDLGLEVHTEIAETGVVGVLRRGNSERSIALRADMDALPIHEANDFAHRSVVEQKMHACGHDGHTAMLLGAAQHLATQGQIDGTLYFIFQPAEENEGGARRMIEEGLFERFDIDSIFGMHNMPGLPPNHFSIRPGSMMAAFSTFECTIHGRGGHSSRPDLAIDPIPIGLKIAESWKQIPSMSFAEPERIICSVTQFHAGTSWNVIPNKASLSGSTRCFSRTDSNKLESVMQALAKTCCDEAGAHVDFVYTNAYPPLINEPSMTQVAADVAAQLVGEERVDRNMDEILGSEDFAWMLEQKKGAYILIGNGMEGAGGCMVHDPHYDFNDEILDLGARYWITLAESYLHT